jgi:hypothetical protein
MAARLIWITVKHQANFQLFSTYYWATSAVAIERSRTAVVVAGSIQSKKVRVVLFELDLLFS